MGFNYALEKKKFDASWSELQEQYAEAGMSETAIQEMRDFDWSYFLSERRYRTHTQELPDDEINDSDEDGKTTLHKRFPSMQTTFDESDFCGRYSWVDSIEDPVLSEKLKMLAGSDLELLTLIAIEGYGQKELEHLGYQKQYKTSRQLAKMKKFLKSR